MTVPVVRDFASPRHHELMGYIGKEVTIKMDGRTYFGVAKKVPPSLAWITVRTEAGTLDFPLDRCEVSARRGGA